MHPRHLVFTIGLLVVLNLKAFSQSNSFALSAGPEIFFRGTVDGIGNIEWIHFGREKFGFVTGIEFKYHHRSNSFDVDSTAYYPPEAIIAPGNVACYCRYYDYSRNTLETGITFKLAYLLKETKKIRLYTLAGSTLSFLTVDKGINHTYKVDLTGITDPGPFTEEYSNVEWHNAFVPDYISFPVLMSGEYFITKHLNFVMSVGGNVSFDFEQNFPFLDLYSLSFPIRLGAVYTLN